jgi:hypothetical protein
MTQPTTWLGFLLNPGLQLEQGGSALPIRPIANIVSGATLADNAAHNRTDITITGGSGSFAPQSSHLTADVSTGTDPTFSNLGSSISASGTQFLLLAIASGTVSGATTPRLQIEIDGSPGSYMTLFGSGTPTAAGAQAAVMAVVTGLSSGSHTFQLRGSSGGGTWSILAASDPTREGAWLIVIPF